MTAIQHRRLRMLCLSMRGGLHRHPHRELPVFVFPEVAVRAFLRRWLNPRLGCRVELQWLQC